MTTPIYDSANTAWFCTLSSILDYGLEVSPRSQLTKELLNNCFAFKMNSPVSYHFTRKLSYKFMAAEALWITSGSNSADDIVPYNKHIAKFSDNGEIFNGAYGPPFNEQLPYVVRSLQEESTTRQAVMTIWNRRPEPSRDIPCTVAMAWNIRDGELNCHVFMRSSDAWLGLPYDMFNFTMMTARVASKLGFEVEPGLMYMNLVSSHLYEQHWEKSEEIVLAGPENKQLPIPAGSFSDWEFLWRSMMICRDLKEKQSSSFWRIRP